MSKTEDEVYEENRKLVELGEVSQHFLIDTEGINTEGIELDEDDTDNSGKILDSHYSYYDFINETWKELIECNDKHKTPLCEYLTVYNFGNFIDNL